MNQLDLNVHPESIWKQKHKKEVSKLYVQNEFIYVNFMWLKMQYQLKNSHFFSGERENVSVKTQTENRSRTIVSTKRI